MAQVLWPSHLPDCAQSWAEQDGTDIIKTANEVGPEKLRRRSAILKRTVNISWTINASLYQQFLEFYETTCLQSINTFPYANPITKAINYYRFSEPPSFQMIQGNGKKVGAVQVSAIWELDQ